MKWTSQDERKERDNLCIFHQHSDILEWLALSLSENGKQITESSYNNEISGMQGCAIQKGRHLVSEVAMVLLGILSLLLL